MDLLADDVRTGPPVRRSRARRGLGVGALALAVGALAVWHPGDDGTPICPLRLLTGLDCPFCGGLRAVGDLGRGDVLGAADQNLFVVAALPILVALWLLKKVRPDRPTSPLEARAWQWGKVAVVVLLLVFTVIRNVPGVPFLGSGIG